MLLLFAVSAFSVQSSYYFAYTTIEDGDYSQWIRPNQTARFKFRLFEDGNLVDPAIEERMRLIGVYPYFYGIDSATVQQSNITSMFDETSWTFEIRASAPGQFCYRVRPNVETVWNIREASVCFGVSNIVTSPGNSIVGKIRKYDQIFGGEVIEQAGLASMTRIESSPFSVLATFMLETRQTCGIPFYSRRITAISPNSFGDTFFNLFNFANYPVLMDQIYFYYMRPDDGIVLLTSKRPLLIENGKDVVVIQDGEFVNMTVGCTRTDCRYAFLEKDLKTLRFDGDDPPVVFEQSVLDMTFNAIDYNNFVVLLSGLEGSQTVYSVLPFSLVNGSYSMSKTVKLPKQHPKSSFFTEPPLVNNETDFAGATLIPLSLNGIHAHHSTYGHMFLYGSALLHSPAFGYGWFLIATFDGRVITDFTSSPVSGKFAFYLEDNHTVFLGSTGSKYLNQFDAAEYFNLTDLQLSQLFFGADDVLYFVCVAENGSITRKVIPVDYFIRRDSDCPYLSVDISSDNPQEVTRVRGMSGLAQSIYLDRDSEYKFNLVFGVRPGESPDLSVIANGNFRVNLDTVNDYLNDIVSYTATIKSNPESSQKVKVGEDFYQSPIIVRVSNAAPRCEFSENTINARIGCPQGLRLVLRPYDPEQSAGLDCLANDAECVDFKRTWNPWFIIEDTIDGSSRNFTGLFSMSVVGAGKTKETITRFTEEQIKEYNEGSTKIWVFDKDDTSRVATSANSSVLWVCDEGSPCSGVTPEPFHAPQLYLVFRVTTNVEYDNSTYCDFDAEFVICLVSLPLAFGYQILTVCSTLVFCILGNMYWYLSRTGKSPIQRRRNRD